MIEIIFLEILIPWSTNLEFMGGKEATECSGSWNIQNIHFRSYLQVLSYLVLEYQVGYVVSALLM